MIEDCAVLKKSKRVIDFLALGVNKCKSNYKFPQMLFIFQMRSFLLILGHGIEIDLRCGVQDIDKFNHFMIYCLYFFFIMISENCINDNYSLLKSLCRNNTSVIQRSCDLCGRKGVGVGEERGGLVWGLDCPFYFSFKLS